MLIFTWRDVVFRSSHSVIRRCVHRQTSNQFVVKIIDVAKFAADPKLNTEGLCTQVYFKNLYHLANCDIIVYLFSLGLRQVFTICDNNLTDTVPEIYRVTFLFCFI